MKIYRFRVRIQRQPAIYRDIDIEETTTLDIFHQVIQDAFGFADDHLYSFFMTNDEHDRDHEYSIPEAILQRIPLSQLTLGEPPPLLPMTDAEFTQHFMEVSQKPESDAALDALRQEYIYREKRRLNDELKRDVATTTLKSLKLRKGKKFLYLFDYGDMWYFNVELLESYTLPRIVNTVGKSPPQYGDWLESNMDEATLPTKKKPVSQSAKKKKEQPPEGD